MKTGFFTIVLQCCFLYNERQCQNEASLHKKILSAPLFTVTSCGKTECPADKVHNIHVTIFPRVFSYRSKQSKHVFSSWITTNLYQQHTQMNELYAVWVKTEESLKRYPACELVPFPADRKGGIFGFILKTTKSRHRTTILSYVSLQPFIYSLVLIPLQCKLLILATVQFK